MFAALAAALRLAFELWRASSSNYTFIEPKDTQSFGMRSRFGEMSLFTLGQDDTAFRALGDATQVMMMDVSIASVGST